PASLLERPCRATAPYTHLRPRKPIRVRIPVSPSPQPSPLGRGSAVAHGFGDCEGPGSSNDGKWFSLSPRERVGVRGKCAFELARALSKIRVSCSCLPSHSIKIIVKMTDFSIW